MGGIHQQHTQSSNGGILWVSKRFLGIYTNYYDELMGEIGYQHSQSRTEDIVWAPKMFLGIYTSY